MLKCFMPLAAFSTAFTVGLVTSVSAANQDFFSTLANNNGNTSPLNRSIQRRDLEISPTPTEHATIQDTKQNNSVMLAQAFQIYGEIFDKWQLLRAERGPLGNVTSDEADAANGGRYNNFQYGFIYWRPNKGAYAVYGAIGEKWNIIGRERGPLGYPISDEADAANGGRYNNFDYGFIYWHPQIGAYAVYGFIGEKWNSLGRERGPLGYPISDELAVGAAGGRVSYFQNGSISWRPGGEPIVVLNQ